MDDELSKELMIEQLEELQQSPLFDRHGWGVETDDFDLSVIMPSPKNGEEYELQVNFDDFPEKPPSYLFNGKWPNCPDIKQNKGVCIHGTREFYNEFGHDERLSEWDYERYTLTLTLQKIHHLMRK
jgi:ubiquitin-protein ligase